MVYLAQAVDDGGMVATTEEAGDLGHPLVGILSKEVHSNVPSLGDLLGAALAGQGLSGEVEVLGDGF
jgi:hypothetical protein